MRRVRSSRTSSSPTRSTVRRPRRNPRSSKPMQEYQVTAGGQKPPARPKPFFVLATQNPIEQEGTYPLPEAQLDRFMFMIKVDYPTASRRSNEILRLHDREPASRSSTLVHSTASRSSRIQEMVRRRRRSADHVHAVRLGASTRRDARARQARRSSSVRPSESVAVVGRGATRAQSVPDASAPRHVPSCRRRASTCRTEPTCAAVAHPGTPSPDHHELHGRGGRHHRPT